MKVSVIIPVYNVSNYIEKSIVSICNQTMQEGVECIIVNDCTPDDSMAKVYNIIHNYTGAIEFKIINHDNNKGLAAARNSGMKVAKGDYVLHLDSDDFYDDSLIEDLYCSAVCHNSDVAICDIYQTNIHDESVYKVNTLPSREDYVKALLDRNYNLFLWNIWNKLIKRKLFVENEISWKEGINNGEDLLICTKLFCFVNNVSKVNKPLYHYTHYNMNSFSNTTDIMENELHIIEEITDFFKKKGLYNKYIENICFRKLSAKLTLLSSEQGFSNLDYHRLFPEANKYIYKHPRISFLPKLKLYISSLNPKFYVFLHKLLKHHDS